MKIRLLLFSLSVFALSTLVLAQEEKSYIAPSESSLINFVDEKAEFSAIFPGAVSSSSTSEGRFDVQSVKNTDGEATYTVRKYTSRSGSISSDDFIVVLRGWQVSKLNRNIVEERSFVFKQGTGKELITSGVEGRTLTRHYPVGEVHFVVSVTLKNWKSYSTEGQQRFNVEVNRFFASFDPKADVKAVIRKAENEFGKEDVPEGWETNELEGIPFSARFPGKPKFSQSETKTDNVKIQIREWVLAAEYFNYFVGVSDTFVVGDLDDKNSKRILDGWQKGLEEVAELRVVSSSDVRVRGKLGRKMILEADEVSRIIIAWPENGSLIQAFVDSAPYTSAEGLERHTLELDRLISGLAGDIVSEGPTVEFRNEGLRMKMMLPNGWVDLNLDKVTEAAKANTKANKKMSSREKRDFRKSINRTTLLFIRSRFNDQAVISSFTGGFEVLPVRRVSTKTIARNSYNSLRRNLNTRGVSPPKYVKHGKHDYYMFEFEVTLATGVKARQRMFMKKRLGGFLQFSMIYVENEDLDLMTEALKTLELW